MESTPPPGFVIALCAMTRAIPIPQPRSSPLNRYRFFLTRRSAEGREFFVLHMGHFATAEEAEKWLDLLRGTYPNAYVSDTSGVLSATPSALTDTQVLRVLEVRKPAPTEEPARPPAPRRTMHSLLDESLQDLAARELDTGAHESPSDTGVRHLSIQVVDKRRPWRKRARIR
jgi:hypothetical protein